MRIFNSSYLARAFALTLCLSIVGWTGASLAAPATVTATQGTVVVMRGNTVLKLSAGDTLKYGDRIIASNASSATLSGGTKVGPNSIAISSKDNIKVVSKTSGQSSSKNTGAPKTSNLFWDNDEDDHDGRKSYGDDDDRDGGKHGDDDDDDDRDHDDHDKDHPWHGHPKDPNPCTSY